MRNRILLSLGLAFFFLPASYGRNERVVVFGDSLSDNGNCFALTGGQLPPGPPQGAYGETFDGSGLSFPGRFTDGRNWVDYLPQVEKVFQVHIPTLSAFFQNPSAESASDFAIGGSTSEALNVLDATLPSFPKQIGAYLKSLGTNSAARDLCVIWIGANDFAAGINPLETVANIKGAIAQLAGAGVEKFAVVTIPDLALTPEVKAAGAVLAAQNFVFTVNLGLEFELPQFAQLHQINISVVDINAVTFPIVFEPARFGFTNSIGSAYNPSSSLVLVPDPDKYVFWDGFHPTTRVDAIAADFIVETVFARRLFHHFLPPVR
jgi:phospholipase/lecithinase/hemolysin